jgi:integrase/recombinase XerD
MSIVTLAPENSEIFLASEVKEARWPIMVFRAFWLSTLDSNNTRTAYDTALRQFEDFIEPYGISVYEVEGHVAEIYRTELMSYLANTSVGLKLSALRSFYDKAKKHRAHTGVTENPFLGLKRPKDGKRRIKSPGMSEEESTAFLDACEAYSPRAYAVGMVLQHMGLRVSELCAADIRHFEIVRDKLKLRVTRKGGFEQLVAVGGETAKALEAYFKARGDREGPVVRAPRGTRETRQGIWRLLNDVAKEHGLSFAVNPHNSRHACASGLLDSGTLSVRQIADLLGHADTSTTDLYLHAKEDDSITETLEHRRKK